MVQAPQTFFESTTTVQEVRNYWQLEDPVECAALRAVCSAAPTSPNKPGANTTHSKDALGRKSRRARRREKGASTCFQSSHGQREGYVANDMDWEAAVERTPSRKEPKVSFDFGLNTVHEITPYSEVYGVHPRYFNFDKNKTPLAWCFVAPPGTESDSENESDNGDTEEEEDTQPLIISRRCRPISCPDAEVEPPGCSFAQDAHISTSLSPCNGGNAIEVFLEDTPGMLLTRKDLNVAFGMPCVSVDGPF